MGLEDKLLPSAGRKGADVTEETPYRSACICVCVCVCVCFHLHSCIGRCIGKCLGVKGCANVCGGAVTAWICVCVCVFVMEAINSSIYIAGAL